MFEVLIFLIVMIGLFVWFCVWWMSLSLIVGLGFILFFVLKIGFIVMMLIVMLDVVVCIWVGLCVDWLI